MAEPREFLARVESIAGRNASFRPEAYLFVLEAVERAVVDSGRRDHVSGEDLLEAIKELGRERFGVMATDVFAAWGVRTTLDFGRCVFHLIDAQLLDKRDEDSLRDFIDRYDFRRVFEQEYFLGKA